MKSSKLFLIVALVCLTAAISFRVFVFKPKMHALQVEVELLTRQNLIMERFGKYDETSINQVVMCAMFLYQHTTALDSLGVERLRGDIDALAQSINATVPFEKQRMEDLTSRQQAILSLFNDSLGKTVDSDKAVTDLGYITLNLLLLTRCREEYNQAVNQYNAAVLQYAPLSAKQGFVPAVPIPFKGVILSHDGSYAVS